MTGQRNIRGLIVGLVGALLLTGASPMTPSTGLDQTVHLIRERCLGILREALGNEEAFVRSGAVRAAGESGDVQVLPLLGKGAHDFFPTTRQFALQGARLVSTAEAVTLAGQALTDSDVWVMVTALEILGESGEKKWVPKIQPLLQAPDSMVRLAAQYALLRLRGTGFDALGDAARAGGAIQRYQAITYLGRLKTEAALARLRELLEPDGEAEVLIYTLKALGSKMDSSFMPRLEPLLAHAHPGVRRQTVLAMGRLPAGTALKRVAALCVDADPLVQLAAAAAVHRLGSGQCGEVFAAALGHPDYGVRSVAARLLGETALPDRPQLLKRALDDPNSRVRTAAVRATGKMGGPAAFPLLLGKLSDSVEVIRAYAAGYLLKLLKP